MKKFIISINKSESAKVNAQFNEVAETEAALAESEIEVLTVGMFCCRARTFNKWTKSLWLFIFLQYAPARVFIHRLFS